MTDTGFTHAHVPGQHGRRVLVTGANTGIGHEAARVLADRGAAVVLGCRSVQRGTRAAERIRAAHPHADVDVVALDLADLGSIAAAAEQVLAAGPLDVLVNNAGVMVPPYAQTVDGFELQLGVNHLGAFALTGRLLPALRDRAGSRVVTTSSIAHRTGRIDRDDLQSLRSYDRMQRYRQSKLANLLFALELDRRLRAAGAATISVACHPGLATTDLGRHMGRLATVALPVLRPVLELVLNSPFQGAWPTLMAATAPTVEGGDHVGPTRRGETAGPAGPAVVADRARDEDTAAWLWQRSIELTGVDPGV